MQTVLTGNPPLPAADGTPDIITNFAFWPDISVNQYREVMRQEGQETPPRLREALMQAMGYANGQLARWAQQQQDAGFPHLSAVPADAIGGESVRVLCYRRAVFFAARALLTEQFRGTDTTHKGDIRASALESTTGDLWRQFHWALSELRGESHMTVALI
ncbi:head completion/stabilization protein [Salmonella enterica]|nr:head completion/stabilization protein [Salmonella enterica]EFO9572899.1 head completion/stabilization protein [Salmonella enterica]EGL8528291.1 head completion/stabilization protein [Salmonella enterica]EID8600174.1 head completion/stabilization protein [Salmonella enterica]EIJ1009827.1 head completion/stabilization protein [Salmonella enterica]